MKQQIVINCLHQNPSFVDGPGYRTVLFLQGCDAKCPGCHNKDTWDITKGRIVDIDDLVAVIRSICLNKKLTITGGEPLKQSESLEILLSKLSDFDLCLYTGKELDEVPQKILKYLKYIKTGRYVQELRTTTRPYVGSTNQIFQEVKHNE